VAVAHSERARTHEAKRKRAAGKEGEDEEEKESTHINKRIEVGWRVDLSRMKARSLDGRRREKGSAAIECRVG
jgi:hypothetical protein